MYDCIAMGAAPGVQVTPADVDAAAASASVSEFVGQLEHGIHTVVGERGGQLSGGQKQRVAIARAMIRRPRVWLLDEATSALDTRSERDVQAALDGIMKATHGSMTTVSVAHRLSTIVHFDTVVVMRRGEVVETGVPSALLQAESVFARCVPRVGGPHRRMWAERASDVDCVGSSPPRLACSDHRCVCLFVPRQSRATACGSCKALVPMPSCRQRPLQPRTLTLVWALPWLLQRVTPLTLKRKC